MPKRAEPQAVLTTSGSAVAPKVSTPLLSGEERQRRRTRFSKSEPPATKETKERRPRSWKRLIKRSGIGIGVLAVLLVLWAGFKFYKDIAHITGNKNPLSILSVFKPVALRNQDGRVNILVAGNSADDAGHNGANLTDSIMVLSVNTKNNTALMLSVPRDLWVNIPGVGYSKINAAFPNGGMDTLQDVVESKLGLTVDYQVLVNYGAFEDLVNALGNISINIASTDPRGIYDPSLDYTSRTCCALAKYPNGQVTLTGKQALNLARARGDGYGSYGYAQSDFTRTMYQREMLIAVKDKASQSSVIANPFKVSGLIDAVGKNITTNLQVNEIETLYTYMKKIDDTKIDSYNINTLKGENTTMLANYTSPSGQSALIPAAGIDDYSEIQTQIQKILTADAVTKEGAITVVLNATDTAGLAAGQKNKLIGKGMDVVIGDAPANQATTTVIDNSAGKKPNTLAYLKKQYKATVTTDASLTAAYPNADFILIMGQSAVPKTSTSTTD